MVNTTRIVVLSVFLIFLRFSVVGQSIGTILNSSSEPSITWLGLDFSHIKLIGEFSQFNGAGDANPQQIRDKYFPAWNYLILEENEKYNIKGALRKDSFVNDISMLLNKNSSTDIAQMESVVEPNYSEDDLKRFVKEYSLEGKDGVGLVFIVEFFNKYTDMAALDVVFFNMQTKEIVFKEKMYGKPMGFGIRNYWAGSIYHIIKDMESRFSVWKNKK